MAWTSGLWRSERLGEPRHACAAGARRAVLRMQRDRLQVARAQMNSWAHNIEGKFALGHSLMLFFAKGHYSNAPLPIDIIVLSLFAGGH